MNNFSGLNQYLITLANSINTLASRIKLLEKNASPHTENTENSELTLDKIKTLEEVLEVLTDKVKNVENKMLESEPISNKVSKLEKESETITNKVSKLEKESETISNKVSILDEKFTKLEKDLETFLSNLNTFPAASSISSTEEEIATQLNAQLNMSIDDETIPIGDDIIIGIKEEKKSAPKKKSTKRL